MDTMSHREDISKAEPFAPPALLQADRPSSESSTPPEAANPSPPLPNVLTRHRSPLLALTGLRFFAAAYVIIFHTRITASLLAHGYTYSANFFAHGFLAVTLFFMLSGFILSYNYRGQIETTDHVIRFWEARYARIWPAYAFSLLCSSIPTTAIPPLPVALATIAMVQSWDPFHPLIADAWNGVCWSLSVEGFFYLVFPFLQRFFEKLRLTHLALLGLFFVILGPFLNISSHFFASHLPEFIVGVILGNLFNHSKRLSAGLEATSRIGVLGATQPEPVSARTRFPFFTVAGCVSSIILLTASRNRWEGMVIASFALLLYGLASERTLLSRFLSTRLLVLGGEISYAMYLLRTPLHSWIAAIPILSASRLVSFLYIPFLLIPFSLGSFYFIEGPSRRGLRRMFATLRRRSS